MKLSYQNIEILADLFEGVRIYKDAENQVWLIKPSDRIRIVVDCFEINGRSKVEGGKFGGFAFDDTTTVSDFKKLCAHLGVELVENTCKHCGEIRNKHLFGGMCQIMLKDHTDVTYFTL